MLASEPDSGVPTRVYCHLPRLKTPSDESTCIALGGLLPSPSVALRTSTIETLDVADVVVSISSAVVGELIAGDTDSRLTVVLIPTLVAKGCDSWRIAPPKLRLKRIELQMHR